MHCAFELSRSGQRDFEQAGRLSRMTRGQEGPQNDLDDVVLRFLEKQLHSSSRWIGKALYSPWTTILRVLDDTGLRFFAPTWIPHRLSNAQKADRVEFPHHMLGIMQELGPKQQKYLITEDESWIDGDNRRRRILAQNRGELPPNVEQTISSKRRWFLLISRAVVLFPLNYFRCDKSTTHSSSLKRSYQALRRDLRSVVRNCEQQQLNFMLTTSNHTPPKCPWKGLKN
jgi:hypothetical protein